MIMRILIISIAIFLFVNIAKAENYHVLAVAENGRSANVIFHIPIPVENNSASVALRTALASYIKTQDTDGTFLAFNSVFEAVGAGELTQLRAGELYEYRAIVKFLAADTNGQKQTKIDNKYTELTTSVLSKIRAILKFHGLNRDVP